MAITAGMASALAELQQHCQGETSDEASLLASYSRNFGGMLVREPAIVLRAVSVQDVVHCLRVAARYGLAVATRGTGHCQSSQALGDGVVIDLRRFARVSVDVERMIVEAEPGATWREVIDATYPLGLLPVGLGQVVDTTLGGTLSVAGIGGESFRTGPQVDCIAYVDVATLDGEVRRCDAVQHRALFDAVRAGLGQCGIIVKVGYELRRCASHMVTSAFVYRGAERFLEDAEGLSHDGPAGRWLTSMTTGDPFAPQRRSLVLFVGQECDGDESKLCALPPLRPDFEMRRKKSPLWAATAQPGHPFFHSWEAPAEGQLHPWVEQLFARDAAVSALEELLDVRNFELGAGSAGVRWIRRRAGGAPLFVTPEAELSIGIGIFASFASGERVAAERCAEAAADRLARHGGIRYLSGYLVRDQEHWRQHYRDVWPRFCDSKLQYDPEQRLNPGFIGWPNRLHL